MSPQEAHRQAGAGQSDPESGVPARSGNAAAPEGGDSLSVIRHSLRTPLNQIIGYCELLLEQSEEQDLVDLLPDLGKIHTAGEQLLALINDTLAPWKLEAGNIDLDAMRLEMRTPLNLIIGYSELCLELAEESDRGNLAPDLQKITGAAKNLLALFESVSFPAQIEVRPKIDAEGATPAEQAVRRGQKAGQDAGAPRGNILIVDDNEMNRDMLNRRLERLGHSITEVENGRQALEALRTRRYDLVLLDVIMPEMNGYETLKALKADPELRHIPVIMLSALDEMDNVIRCIEIGADDYLTKPFNPVLLHARINASLDKKKLRDQERNRLEIVELERQKSRTLLKNILPESIAARLHQGESCIADSYPEATVLVARIVNFPRATVRMAPTAVVELLNDIYSQFDWLVELNGIEKIKTVADCYVAAAGLPVPRANHAVAIADAGLELQRVMRRLAGLSGLDLQLRIGISSGLVVGGVIGRKKFVFDVWGDPVEEAVALTSASDRSGVLVGPNAFEILREKFAFEETDSVELPGKGRIKIHRLTGREGRAMVDAEPPGSD